MPHRRPEIIGRLSFSKQERKNNEVGRIESDKVKRGREGENDQGVEGKGGRDLRRRKARERGKDRKEKCE